jgi:hypothetical protein
VYAQVVCHVGASPGFVPPTLAEVAFSNQGDEGRVAAGSLVAERWEFFGDYFRGDVDRLERMLGRDLSMWRPPASSG